MGGTREWDAETYDRVSDPQLAWGRTVLERLAPEAGETVLDAGCGTGRATELLLRRQPKATVIGVDGSRAMIEAAAGRLGPAVRLIHADLLQLELEAPVDAVFSSATFHWIPDHAALFTRVASWLRPGGRLEAQCGGAGNVGSFFAIVDRVASREPYAETLADLPEARYFAGAEETAALLARTGFVDVRCDLEPSRVKPAEPRAFIAAVALGAHTAALPQSRRAQFIDAVLEEWADDPVMDYVRLNISARKPAPA
jgi:trans-aconitate 2-methyltransferase